jgi:hypothetical protein
MKMIVSITAFNWLVIEKDIITFTLYCNEAIFAI